MVYEKNGKSETIINLVPSAYLLYLFLLIKSLVAQKDSLTYLLYIHL